MHPWLHHTESYKHYSIMQSLLKIEKSRSISFTVTTQYYKNYTIYTCNIVYDTLTSYCQQNVSNNNNKWSKDSDKRPRLREGGGFFTGEKFMWRWPCGSNAVSCSSRADAVDFLQHTPEQWLTVFINGLDNPKNLPLLFGGSEPHLIYSSFGPPVTDPNSISIHSSVLQGSQT